MVSLTPYATIFKRHQKHAEKVCRHGISLGRKRLDCEICRHRCEIYRINGGLSDWFMVSPKRNDIVKRKLRIRFPAGGNPIRSAVINLRYKKLTRLQRQGIRRQHA